MLHKRVHQDDVKSKEDDPVYGGRALASSASKYNIPQNEMTPRDAYQLVHDELMLDGNSRLNLATFVTTWIEPEAKQLMSETFDKNMIDKDEYPQTAEIEMRCVNIISDLFHGHTNDQKEACGCSTIGSSEAAMLCGMSMKWNWKKRRVGLGKDTTKPNFVVGSDVQVCWEKFCVYWEIEMRTVNMSQEDGYKFNPNKVVELCDENTIGVLAILGTTYTGEYQDVKALDTLMEEYNTKTGFNIPIHVDAASGGFIAPFLDPELEWDFRLKWVNSINVSGHKFGLVAPGVGWAMWKDWSFLPEELIFHVNYLGGDMPTFALNFSRPGSQVIAQYYNLMRLGFEGYRKIHQACLDVTFYLRDELEKSGIAEPIVKDIKMPLIAFKLKDGLSYDVYQISDKLRYHGWQVPAYTLPKDCKEVAILRVVAKEGFDYDLATLLVKHIKEAIFELEDEGKKAKVISSAPKVC
ncbi:MAG: glutamate decarboxylase [Helicobacteraceae bacterium]|nr:glutamate decarboxylase [Helicobacteraceae bacterium]